VLSVLHGKEARLCRPFTPNAGCGIVNGMSLGPTKRTQICLFPDGRSAVGRISAGIEGFYLRVPDTIQSTVAFIGYADKGAPGGIRCIGTGFLVAYDTGDYLVTCRHVAEPIDGAPFLVRLNRYDGNGSNAVVGDSVRWYFHPDKNIDLAVTPFHATPAQGYDCRTIPQDDFATDEFNKVRGVGIGDDCYTVGLFRYVTGKKANLPLVYSGTIALTSSEKIPTWNKQKNRMESVDGCLIQSQGIHGASGSPVFVRPCILRETLLNGQKLTVQDQSAGLFLFGMVQGAWFLPPDAFLRAELGANSQDSVPVGVSIVVPIDRLVELLGDSPELIAMRGKNPHVAQ